MNGLWLFLGTLGLFAIIVLILPHVSEPLLRLGLWLNGIDGKYADDIVEHHKTGKLP